MKIATFNANSIRARLEIILEWLARNRPDILCVQETKTPDADFPAEPFEKAGFHAVFSGEKAYNGVAIISKKKPDNARIGLDDGQQPDASRIIAADFGALHVVNTYVPQGREIEHAMYAYKLEWFARLRRYFERHYRKSDLVLWVGDMNVAPEPIDVYAPEQLQDHVCFHKDARAAFAKVVEWGFTDLFRKFHPEPGLYSFFDYREPNAVKRNRGWRLDHMLATSPLADACRECEIDVAPRLAPRPSDHCVVSARFDLKE